MMDGCMNEITTEEKQTNKWINKWTTWGIKKCNNDQIDWLMNKLNEWLKKWMNEQIDGWMNKTVYS